VLGVAVAIPPGLQPMTIIGIFAADSGVKSNGMPSNVLITRLITGSNLTRL
jgi:hypothetical protein